MIQSPGPVGLRQQLVTIYTAEVWDHLHRDGTRCLRHGFCGRKSGHTPRLKWRSHGRNRVVTEGLNALLDNTFGAIPGSVAYYVGTKKTAAGDAAGDILSSHAGWTESVPGTDYTGNRQVWTKNAAASGGAMSNSSAKAVFPCLTSITVYGALMASVATGSAGTLYGVGDFASSRAVQNGDTLNVQIDLSVVTA